MLDTRILYTHTIVCFLNYRDKVKTCNIREEKAKLNSTLYFILNTSPYKQLRTIYKQVCNDTQDMDTVVRLLHRNHIDVYTLARACYMPVDSIRNIIKGDGTLTNYSRRTITLCVCRVRLITAYTLVLL